MLAKKVATIWMQLQRYCVIKCLGYATFCDNGESFQTDISLADFEMNRRVTKI